MQATLDAAPYDRAEFDALTAGDLDLQREVLRTFLATAPAALEAARLAVEGLFPSATSRAAHLLRGSLLAIAAGPAVRAAEELETAGHRGDLHGARRAYEALAARMAVLLETLRSETRTQG